MGLPSHGDTLGKVRLAITVVFIPLSILAVVLRLWSRWLRGRNVGSSDYFIIAGFLLALGQAIIDIVVVVAGGSGKDITDTTASERRIAKNVFKVEPQLWLAATCCLKLSIVLLYMELFPGKKFRRACYGVIALIVAFYIAFVVGFSLNYLPCEKKVKAGEAGSSTCPNITAAVTVSSVMNMVIDAILIIMPVPIVWKLRLPTSKKIGILCMFSVGILITFVNIARIATSYTINSSSNTYSHPTTGLLVGIEVWLGIWAACLPTMHPAWAQLRIALSSLVSKSRSRRSRTTTSGNVRNEQSEKETAMVDVSLSSTVASGSTGTPLHSIPSGDATADSGDAVHSRANQEEPP